MHWPIMTQGITLALARVCAGNQIERSLAPARTGTDLDQSRTARKPCGGVLTTHTSNPLISLGGGGAARGLHSLGCALAPTRIRAPLAAEWDRSQEAVEMLHARQPVGSGSP